MLFMFTAKSGKFLHSRFERKFTVITSIQEKIASTVNNKQLSVIITHKYYWCNTIKIQEQTLSKYVQNPHTTVPLTNRVRIAVHLLQIDPEQR